MADIGSPKVKAKKAAHAGDVIEVKTLIKHPMESGLRKDKNTGEVIPAHHITELTAEYLGKAVVVAKWTGAISKNPFFSFYIKASAAGPLKVTWKDNQGGEWSATEEVVVG